MPHDKGSENISAADDLVRHDPDPGLQVVVATPKLLKRGNCTIARAVRVVNRRAIQSVTIVPDGEFFGDRERLTVANNHPDDVVIRRYPTSHERVDSHARQTNLASGAGGVLKGQGRQLLLMGPPPHLRRCRSLFSKAFDAPRINELVDFLGPIGDLRIALTAMNNLDPKLVSQMVELSRRRVVGDPLGLCAVELPISQRSITDVQEGLFGEVANQPWVGSVFHHGGWSGLVPGSNHSP